MKKSRTLFTLGLALVMIFSLCSGVFAAETFPPNTFTDVPRDQWFAEAVDCVQSKGIMNGVGEGRFDPYGKVTRGMVVTVLYRLAEQPSVEGMTCSFTDLTQDWYKNAVIWASNNGVTNGVSATAFAPDQAITREQMATLITRFLLSMSELSAEDQALLRQIENNTLVLKTMLAGVYSDAGKVSNWAMFSVFACNYMGIMKGDTSGTFRPADTLNRAECAQTFLNIVRVAESMMDS